MTKTDEDMKKIQILDTTLRDGAQSEGIAYSVQDKVKIAKILDGFCVDARTNVPERIQPD